jgi:glycerol dehydrogenase
MVIADTEVIAAAPVRFLVAGMGDAMATFYEARACQNNPDACSLIAPLTYRPPRIAMAIAGACLEVLFCQGVQAKDDCEQGRLSTAVDEVSSCNVSFL